jgi:FKBP12-rapamycin complex-associated protein
MSMVGYILGLGDRHPSNLMLDRITGKIIHIDFGDCFEVAMHRDKYPERVPFRLTRMLTYAMEVSNIEGSFRITCENVMRVLRDNKESLMAVLEAVSATSLSEAFPLTIVVHSRSTLELASYGGYFTSRSQLPL